jgi:Restriction endonuclease
MEPKAADTDAHQMIARAETGILDGTMARPRRRDDLPGKIGALILGSLILVAALSYLHKLPLFLVTGGHDLLLALSPALAQRVESAFPPGHADLGDLVPFLCLIVLLTVVLMVVSRAIRQRAGVRRHTLGELQIMTSSEFEEAIAALLRAQGYREVQVVSGAEGHDVDIVASDERGRLVVVLCQRCGPAERIGSRMIQKFSSLVHGVHRAEVGIFVTTSGYTEPALTLARQSGLILLDGRDLSHLMSEPTKRHHFQPPAA